MSTELEQKIADFAENQVGTAGWEQKLLNLVEDHTATAVREFADRVVQKVWARCPDCASKSVRLDIGAICDRHVREREIIETELRQQWEGKNGN